MTDSPMPPAGGAGLVDPVLLGARIRALRESRAVSLRQLARQLGISASAVSQIERGLLRPSVNRLLEIVTLLDGSLSDVLDDGGSRSSAATSDSRVQVHRATDAVPNVLASGVVYRTLAGSRESGIDYFESTYPPSSTADASGSFVTHEGREVGLVVAGRLTVEVEEQTVELGPGDTIVFPSRVPHRLSNRGPEPAIANWLIVRGLD